MKAKSQWRVFSDAHTPKNTGVVAKRLLRALGKDDLATTIEPYHRGGHKISFEIEISGGGWPEVGFNVLRICQMVGRGWILNGHADEMLDLISNESSVSGVATLHVTCVRIDRPRDSAGELNSDKPQSADAETSFEIEASLEIHGRGYVFAHVLSDAGFEVHDGATLGDVPIERWLEQPRALQEDGTLRADLFVFCVTDAQDLRMFKKGMLVALTCHKSDSWERLSSSDEAAGKPGRVE